MLNQKTCEDGYSSELPLQMLKMRPDAIADNWPTLKDVIEQSLPPSSTPSEDIDRMTNILSCLIAGSLEVHVFFKVINGATFIYGVTVLSKIRNVEDSAYNMLIYAAYGHTKYLFENGLGQCLDLVKKYARGQGCKAIMAYSSLPFVINAIKQAGGSSDYRLLMLEV